MAYNNRDLDDLLRDIVDNDIQPTIKDVERTVREAVSDNDNVFNKYDSLEDMMRKEVQMPSGRSGSSRPTPARVDYSKAKTRYEYFMMSIASARYDSRYRGHYREGHEEAVQKYMDKVEINKNNLSMVEKVLRQEISSYPKTATADAWGRGYIDGLNFVARILKRSQEEMMRRIYNSLKSSIRF